MEDMKITMKDGKVKLYINGLRVNNVRQLSFEANLDSPPTLLLDICPYKETIIKEEQE